MSFFENMSFFKHMPFSKSISTAAIMMMIVFAVLIGLFLCIRGFSAIARLVDKSAEQNNNNP